MLSEIYAVSKPLNNVISEYVDFDIWYVGNPLEGLDAGNLGD